MSNPDRKSNEPYRQLDELQGAELNVCAQSTSNYHINFENGTERSMELSSVVVIPDGMLQTASYKQHKNVYNRL